MSTEPNQPESDEADRTKEPSPIGVARDLEARADATGAETDPSPDRIDEAADEAVDEARHESGGAAPGGR